MQVQVRLLPKEELQLLDKKRDVEIKTIAVNETINKGKQRPMSVLSQALSLKKDLDQIEKSLSQTNVYDVVADRCEITFRD